jgi:DNA repair photolyase
LGKNADIGIDETCANGCKYCYVTSSGRAPLENFKRHDPKSPTLR